tara:strand:- start:160 stop:1254 length:1095 start_codon:yes stop_codon:yes gene_type:complete
MKKITVSTNLGSYKIYIGNKILNRIDFMLKKNNIISNKFLIIIDSNVPKKYKKIFKSKYFKKKYIISIKFNERKKNYQSVEKILEILQKNNFNRNDSIVCLGGGIAGDLCGFAASIFKRGLKFINIPTTLLSQVDSSIGGKTGFNTKFGKNLIGTFYQPSIVISDTETLNSLSQREITCGYAEILKHALIQSKSFYNFLIKKEKGILKVNSKDLQIAIYKSCLIKKKIIQLDTMEKNIRKILNFGHTFGHAYESTFNFSNKLNHGEAVLLGMVSATKLSNRLKILNKKNCEDILNHFEKLSLPRDISKYFNIKNIDKIIHFMKNDKKNIDEYINLILLSNIGKTTSYKINKKLLKGFLKNELSK